jgi:hypothetical protein
MSDEHPEKEVLKKSSLWGLNSNVNRESDLQPEKEDLARILTDEGRQIDVSDEHPENACASIRSR